MGNSLRIRAPSHYLRVDLHDPAEAEYWLIVLDTTRWQIEQAVAAVGTDARDVDAYLRGRSPQDLQPNFPNEGRPPDGFGARPERQ